MPRLLLVHHKNIFKRIKKIGFSIKKERIKLCASFSSSLVAAIHILFIYLFIVHGQMIPLGATPSTRSTNLQFSTKK